PTSEADHTSRVLERVSRISLPCLRDRYVARRFGRPQGGEKWRGYWKNSGGRCGLEPRPPLRRVAERPHRGEQRRDDDAGQADLVAPHLERHGGDEQQHRQQGEARQGPTSVAASAGQAPSVQRRQSVSASTGTIVTR